MDPQLQPPFVLLEDRTAGGGGRLFRDPVEIVRCGAGDDVLAALHRLQAGRNRGLHAAGCLAYEAGQALEPRLCGLRRQGAVGPDLVFGLFHGSTPIDGEALDALFGALPPPPLRDVRLGQSRAEHIVKVEAVKALIDAGDVYQVNLTFPIHFQCVGDPLGLYAALRVRQPVAYGGVVALDGETVLSVSPELFVAVRGSRATVRPMKGTAARGEDGAADAAARRRLAANPKERAENLMIVDLMRNDLSRVCQAGTVKVRELFSVETYPTFHTLTSTVTATLRPDIEFEEILTGLFPCGSVVGAPKIRAAEIIADLEAQPRGVYTGGVGAVGPDGDMDFSVAIRTATIGVDGRGRFGVGGGIVADSDPDAEYDEACLKGRVLTDLAADYQLIETLRWTPAGFVRLAEHLERLGRSARGLGFAFNMEAAARQAMAAAENWSANSDRRARMTLHQDGRLDVSQAAMGQEADRVLRLGLYGRALDAGDPFLRHKTTRRALQEAAASEAAAAGLDEMILLNRRGVVADGARNSVFVEHVGRLLTPPVRAGALPGILRAELIATGRAVEAEVTLAHLKRGAVFIGNSLRGLRPCTFVAAGGSGAGRRGSIGAASGSRPKGP